MISNDLLKRTPVRLAGAFAHPICAHRHRARRRPLLHARLRARGASASGSRRSSDALRAIDAEQGFDDLAASSPRKPSRSATSTASSFCAPTTARSAPATCRTCAQFTGWGELDRAWLPTVAERATPTTASIAMWTPVSKGQICSSATAIGRSCARCSAILLHGLAGRCWRRSCSLPGRRFSWPAARKRRSTCSRRRCRR